MGAADGCHAAVAAPEGSQAGRPPHDEVDDARARLDRVQKGCQLLADILYHVVSAHWEKHLQIVFGGHKDVFYTTELFEQTASGVPDGRAHIFPNWGHGRTSTSSSTAGITLGFLLAALGRRHAQSGGSAAAR